MEILWKLFVLNLLLVVVKKQITKIYLILATVRKQTFKQLSTILSNSSLIPLYNLNVFIIQQFK